MRDCFVIFLCLILTIIPNINSLAISPSVDADGLDLALILEVFWSAQPTVFQKIKPLNLCPFIAQCCSTENRLAAISSLVNIIFNVVEKNPSYENLIAQCVDSSIGKEDVQYYPSIPLLLSYSKTDQDRSEIRNYIQMMIEIYTHFYRFFELTYEICTDEEIHAFVCLSNSTLVKACVKRTLQEMYDAVGYKSYQNSVEKIRNGILNFLSNLYVSTNERKHTSTSF